MINNSTYSYYKYYLRYLNIAQWNLQSTLCNPQIKNFTIEVNFNHWNYRTLYWIMQFVLGRSGAVKYYWSNRNTRTNNGLLFIGGSKKNIYSLLSKCKFGFLRFADDLNLTTLPYTAKCNNNITIYYHDMNITPEVIDHIQLLLEPFKMRVHLNFLTLTQAENINLVRQLQLPVEIAHESERDYKLLELRRELGLLRNNDSLLIDAGSNMKKFTKRHFQQSRLKSTVRTSNKQC